MNNRILSLTFSLMLVTLIGCSPVKVYSDAALTKKAGIKVYTVKPYLRVERDAENGTIVRTEVLYLPDLANPSYIALKNGPGSRKVDLKLTNGCISSFGYSSDTKIDEYVDALSALLSKGTYAVTNLDALKVPPAVKAAPNAVELYEVVMEEGKTVLRKVVVSKE